MRTGPLAGPFCFSPGPEASCPPELQNPRERVMDDRATIEAILDKAYAARRAQRRRRRRCLLYRGRLLPRQWRPGATANRCRADQPSMKAAVRGLRASRDEHPLPDHRPAARGGALARHVPGAERQAGETDILDLIEVRDGKIASLTTFFDTAYAAALSAATRALTGGTAKAANARRCLP